MPDLSQLINVLGPLVAILAIVLGAVFGTGSSSSSDGITPPKDDTVIAQPARPSTPQQRPAPVATPDIDRYGCDKNSPSYFKCVQEKQSQQGPLKNPPLTPAEIERAKQKQFSEIEKYRADSKRRLSPMVRDRELEKEAQAFAEYLAGLPGNEIFHSKVNGGVENVGMNSRPGSYDDFFNHFVRSAPHASNMEFSASFLVKAGIGIAQDPVTGYYYCVQRFK